MYLDYFLKKGIIMFMLWIILGLAFPAISTGAQYLVRTSPGGDGIKPAGVWAGRVDTDDNGQADDLFMHGFSSIDGVNSTMLGLEVTTLSRDPAGRGLLLVTQDTQGRASLAIGSGLCGDSKPQILLHNVRPVDDEHPYMSDAECGHRCGWGPVGLYDGQVYFVLTAVYGKIYSQLSRQMEIRLLDTSADCAEELGAREDKTTKDFRVLECSSLVATLFTEPYMKPLPAVSRWSSKHLAVGSHSKTLHFYLQLIDVSGDDPEIRLVHVAAGDGSMRQLTASSLADVFAGSLSVSGLGSVDYRDGTLCWTAGDTLRCSLHEPGGGVQPVIILPTGEARAKGICTGNIPDTNLKNAVTGVAIAESSSRRLAVYFGCYAQIPGTGGVGLVTLSHNGLMRNVYSVTSLGRKVYGSHVIIMSRLRLNCPLGSDDTTPGDVMVTSEDPPCTCGTTRIANNGASHHGLFMSLLLTLIVSAHLSIL